LFEIDFYLEIKVNIIETMNFKILILPILIFITNISNAQTQPKGFDYGHVEDNKYINSFFDFDMILPNDWFVQSNEQIENLAKIGKKLVAGDDSKMEALLNASEINTAYLLMMYQYERGSAVEYNPSISIIAENIHNSPGIRKGSDYLFHARKLFLQSQLKYDYLDEEFKKEVINGVDFYTMNAKITYLSLIINQTYYVTIKDGFCFMVICSYINDEQKQEMLKSINSMKFKK
jgi:hypothetical protein